MPQRARVPVPPLAHLLVAALCVAVAPAAAAKTILVVGPHPDDEVMMAGGVARRAITAGDTVKLVVVTNGDAAGGTSTGLMRQAESVAAAQVLGLAESDVVFLGYPDGSLRAIHDAADSTQLFTSAAGQTATYGARGLGGVDFHRWRTGVAGRYDRATVLSDFRALVTTFAPDEVYTTSHFDAHADHQAVGLFLTEALVGLKRSGTPIATKLFQSVIWTPDGSIWPDPSGTGACDPAVPYPQPPQWAEVTPLDWATLRRQPVPPEMQDANPAVNLKCRALQQYRSQIGLGLMGWARRDEIFFLSDLGTNLSVTAQVTASSDAAGRGGTAAADGVVDGGVHDPDREWVTAGQQAGAWIRLAWPQPMRVAQVDLHDRPDAGENVLSGTLSFSDGSSIAVGALPPDGTLRAVTFAPRTVTWVRFTVTAAEGTATGLSELQVSGRVAGTAPNLAPHLVRGPVAPPDAIADSQKATVTARAHDLDGDAVQWAWSVDAGSVAASGASATFTPPKVSARRYVGVTARVDDGRGGSASNVTYVAVDPAPSDSLAVSPPIVYGGAPAVGTVTLAAPAPSGGATIPLASSSAAVRVPSSAAVPAGAVRATFAVTTAETQAALTATITATISGTPHAASLTVNPTLRGTLAVSPASVLGGDVAVGTVALDQPAPAGGVSVPLESDGPAASVPGSVAVPGGATTATFPVTTSVVSTATAVTLSATLGATTATAALTVQPSGNLLLSPRSIGDARWGLWGAIGATLDHGTAPSGAREATLAASTTATHALVQAGVSVSPGTAYVFSFYARNDGGRAASYSVHDVTHGRDLVPPTAYLAQISGSAWTKVEVPFTTPAGCTQINVYPLRDSGAPVSVQLWGASLLLASASRGALGVAPAAVPAGEGAVGTVTLAAAAGPGGVVVPLASNKPGAAAVPAAVTVAAGATRATFPVSTAAVAAEAVVTLAATVEGTDVTALLRVVPSFSGTLALAAGAVEGGRPVAGSVTLSAPAPEGGVVIPIASSSSAAVPPASVTVPAGETAATFAVTTAQVLTPTSASLTATIGTSVERVSLLVNPPGNVLASPNAIGDAAWGSWGTVTATVGHSASPSGAMDATLAVAPPEGGHALVQVGIPVAPGTRYVFSFYAMNAGGTAASYSVHDLTHGQDVVPSTPYLPFVSSSTWTKVEVPFTTPAGCTQVNVYVLRDSSAAVRVLLWGASLRLASLSEGSLEVAPAVAVAGEGATGTVTLASPAPAGGTVVPLTSNAPAVSSVPASVTVPAGATSATFPVATHAVAAPSSLTLTARIGADDTTARLTVAPGVSGALTILPATVAAWQSAQGTISFATPVPAGGLVVPLSSSDPAAATVPPSLSVPEGATSATFTISTAAVSAVTEVLVSATLGASVATATLTVDPSSLPGNLLVAPYAVGDAGWMLWGPVTATLRAAEAPGGAVEASRFVTSGGHAVVQQVTVAERTEYLFSFWARNLGGGAASYSVHDVVHGTDLVPPTPYVAQLAGAAWTEVTVAFTTPPGCTSIYVYPLRDSGGTVDVLLWGASLSVLAPAAANGLAVSPAEVVAGLQAQGTVTLASPAPAGGAQVSLSSDQPAVASAPASVAVAAGTTTATFTVSTGEVPARTLVTLTATIEGLPYTAPLTVIPPASNPNLLVSPEAIGGEGWASWGGVTATLGAGFAPDGSPEATRAVSGGAGHALVQPLVIVSPSTTYTFSFFARSAGGAAASHSVYDANHGTDLVPPTSYVSRLNGSTWSRVSVTFTTPPGCTSIHIYPLRDSGGPVDLFLWGAKLEVGSIASGYP